MSNPAAPVLVARQAMATRFEIALHGQDRARLHAAGEEALDEIDRLEALLSLYRDGTDIARANASAHLHPVRLTPEVFRLLERTRELSGETGGAFDITIAPLVRCWGFMGGTGSMPDDSAIAQARANVGMDLIELNKEDFTIRFKQPGVMLDLGAIGKGYAIDRAVAVLREAGVGSALIHGGTSSTFAIGRRPSGEQWKVAITSPNRAEDRASGGSSSASAAKAADVNSPYAPVAVVALQDESLSVSAVWGRSFRAGEKSFGHVLDPRSGLPAEAALLTAVILPSATDGDALSTALLARPALLDKLFRLRPDMRCLVVAGNENALDVITRGRF